MNILIIDDHQLFAESLKMLLQSLDSSMTITCTQSATETIEHLKNAHIHPDLIILDVNLPGINGFSLMHQFQSLDIWSPVLILSATESPSIIKTAIESGASGFIAKSCNSASLVNAINTVMRGEIYTPNTTYQSDSKDSPSSEDGFSHITNRQKEILHLLAQGLINKQIASELGISANTVKAHLYEIFRSLNVRNRTSAVKVALRQGLINQL